jgi:hypothetical protein
LLLHLASPLPPQAQVQLEAAEVLISPVSLEWLELQELILEEAVAAALPPTTALRQALEELVALVLSTSSLTANP